VVVDLRKEVVDYLKSGKKLDVEELNRLVLKHKTGKEAQFRAYKNFYTIFFPRV
jgi:5-methylcytosine-specific restriction protein B